MADVLQVTTSHALGMLRSMFLVQLRRFPKGNAFRSTKSVQESQSAAGQGWCGCNCPRASLRLTTETKTSSAV
eukprot:1289074-Amphidinium_carterae.1